MTKRKIGGLGTGRGLGALLPVNEPSGVREIPTDSIRQNPRQPRTYFDDEALDELAASIREHGVIQPLIVSKRDEDSYELIAGERRWRAAQRAGLAAVPVIVRETTPQQLLDWGTDLLSSANDSSYACSFIMWNVQYGQLGNANMTTIANLAKNHVASSCLYHP